MIVKAAGYQLWLRVFLSFLFKVRHQLFHFCEALLRTFQGLLRSFICNGQGLPAGFYLFCAGIRRYFLGRKRLARAWNLLRLRPTCFRYYLLLLPCHLLQVGRAAVLKNGLYRFTQGLERLLLYGCDLLF